MRAPTRGAFALLLVAAWPLHAVAQCCGDCNGDGEVRIDELVRAVGVALSSCEPLPTPTETSTPVPTETAQARFIDNGDGTVSDTQTGLMWEMKTDDSKDDTYAWSASDPLYPTAPDGTVFTVFLGGLNSCVWPGYGTEILGGFAGHCDWRLSTIVELQTIVDLTASGCGSGSPCIDPAFGPTVASVYWSSTAGPGIPTYAYGVDFFDGGAPVLVKTDSSYVRAVRGAL